MLLKNVLRGSSSFVGASLFECWHFGGSKLLRFIKVICFKNDPGGFFICLGILVFPRMHNVGFGGSGHVRKSRNHRNDCFLAPIIKSALSYTKSKQNNSSELLLNLLFKHMFHRNVLKMVYVF